MKRIVLVSLAKRGGGILALRSMAEGFIINGNEVHCVISKDVENQETWEQSNCIIHYIDTGNTKTFICKYIKFILHGMRMLKNELKNTKIDVLIFYFSTPFARYIEKAVNAKKSFVVCHDPVVHKGEKWINKFFSEIEYRRASNIIVLSNSFRELVSQKFNIKMENIWYMPHGLYSIYRNDQHEKRDNWYKDDAINFLFFGRIERYKGVGLLIDAFLDINAHYKSTLTIAGEGELFEELKKLRNIPNARVIKRYIDDNEIVTLFNHEKVVTVLPYIEATQSGIIATAAFFSTPIIASDTGGLVEQLDGGKVGVIFKCGDVNSLKEAMLQFIEFPNKIKKEKKKLEHYKEKYSWENITNNFLKELSE